jgi:hypothetical protein
MGDGPFVPLIGAAAVPPAAGSAGEEEKSEGEKKPAKAKSRVKFTPIIAVGMLDGQRFIPNADDLHIPIVYPKLRTRVDVDLGKGFSLMQTTTLKYGHILPFWDGKNPDGSAMIAFAEEAQWLQYRTGLSGMPMITIGNDNRYKFGGDWWTRGLAGPVLAIPNTKLTLLATAGILGYPYEQKAAIHEGLTSFTWLGVIAYTFDPHFKLQLISEGEYCPGLNNGWMNTILEAEFPL